jgi:hypothetical protein
MLTDSLVAIHDWTNLIAKPQSSTLLPLHLLGLISGLLTYTMDNDQHFSADQDPNGNDIEDLIDELEDQDLDDKGDGILDSIQQYFQAYLEHKNNGRLFMTYCLVLDRKARAGLQVRIWCFVN